MAAAPPIEPAKSAGSGRSAARQARPDRKPSAAALRKMAQAHSEAALQVLAEVATKGNNEASRIAAAMALLDRGYGKSGTGLASDGAARAPILYHRIELIDGTEDVSKDDDQHRIAAAPAPGV